MFLKKPIAFVIATFSIFLIAAGCSGNQNLVKGTPFEGLFDHYSEQEICDLILQDEGDGKNYQECLREEQIRQSLSPSQIEHLFYSPAYGECKPFLGSSKAPAAKSKSRAYAICQINAYVKQRSRALQNKQHRRKKQSNPSKTRRSKLVQG